MHSWEISKMLRIFFILERFPRMLCNVCIQDIPRLKETHIYEPICKVTYLSNMKYSRDTKMYKVWNLHIKGAVALHFFSVYFWPISLEPACRFAIYILQKPTNMRKTICQLKASSILTLYQKYQSSFLNILV